MKKFLVVLTLVVMMSSSLFAKGGVGPFLASCCIGPRVGLEMNDGSSIRTMEWIGLVLNVFTGLGNVVYGAEAAMGKSMNEARANEGLGGSAVRAAKPKDKGGVMPFLAGCCIGPRVGLELNDGRKIRVLEWWSAVPILQIIPRVIIAVEAGSGKTMSQIVTAEGLDR